MKNKLFSAIMALALVLPATLTYAAYNDVTLDVDVTEVTVGGITVSVVASTGTIENITVSDSDYFDVSLKSNSTVTFRSATGKHIDVSAEGKYLTQTCSSTYTVTIAKSDDDSLLTARVYPKSYACSTSGSTTTSTSHSGGIISSGGGGGGGGGGGVSNNVATVVDAPKNTEVGVSSGGGISLNDLVELLISLNVIKADKIELARSVVKQNAALSSVSTSFKRELKFGTTHADVKSLQIILNRDIETRVSASGVGSAGKETTYFGEATRNAVRKFQKKYGIAKEGVAGFGNVGPKTREKLNELAK